MENAAHSLPAAPAISASEIATLTGRLAQLLAEEVDLLDAMQIEKVKELQKEKLFIANALEVHRRNLVHHPHLADSIPSRDKHHLEGVVKVFEDILAENHRKLSIAREANRRVVHAVTQVVKKNAASAVYSDRGVVGVSNQTLSVTLNHTA